MQNTDPITFYTPESTDGDELNLLVESCPPLDTNSVYCNLLQCTHFNATSICAKRDGEMVGFISGYLIPERPDTLFVWQVAVAESARGQGLALRMLQELTTCTACRDISFVETTITPSNKPSQNLFLKFAAQSGAKVSNLPGFDHEAHFNGKHESEELWRIGPLNK